MDCNPPGSSVHGILQARILEWVPSLQGIFLTQGSNCHLLCLPALAGGFFITSTSWEAQSRGSSQPTALQADSLPSEPPGKPMNTGVGSLSILQGIFPFQESNRGLLHCRRILYQLSYQGNLWLLLLSTMFSRCTHIIPWMKTSFLFTEE